MSKSMEEANKIVVKVKYKGSDKDQPIQSNPKMVTKWHIKRILIALALLFAFIWLLFHFFGGQSIEPVNSNISESNSAKDTQSAKVIVKLPEIVAEKKLTKTFAQPAKIIKEAIITKSAISPAILTDAKKEALVSEPIVNPNIVRTLLTSELVDKEPVDIILSPLIAEKDRATKVYYFTEIINMKGQVLFHRWLRNNKLIYEREINVIGNRWRASTSKLITYSNSGKWIVRLEDIKGDILNEIKFEVIQE